MPPTILVIDDSPSLRQLLHATLSDAGYSVLQAGNGRDALELLDGRTVCLAVCDLNMPVMNGLAFLQAARRLPDYQSLPVVMLTTQTQTAVRHQARAAGARAWMVKPFAPATLLANVARYCAA